MRWLSSLIFLLLLPICFASIQINEVMYAPTNANEWVELYNPTNQTINMSGFELEDSSSLDQIACCDFDNECSLLVKPFSYALLTDQDTTLYEGANIETTKLCVDDNSIGNGLGNTQDSLRIFTKGYEARYSYHKDDGGYLNNKTLERRSDDTWGQSLANFGTPGRENSIWHLSAEFENIIITEFMANPFGNADDQKPGGEWVELYNKGDSAIDLSGLILKDKDDENELYISHTTVLQEHPVIDAHDYLIVYRNGDSDFALNDIGYEEVRLFAGDIILDSVSYSGTTPGMSVAKLGNLWQETAPTPGVENIYVEDCDWQLSVDLDESMFKGDDLDFSLQIKRLVGGPANITVVGKIVDEFGTIVKEYRPATNKKITSVLTKSYSPNLPEGVYQLTFDFVGLACNDLDSSNNKVHEILATNPRYKQDTPTIRIESINVGRDNKVEWADQFDVKVHAYKGNSTRESLQVWVQESEGDGEEKLSKVSRALLTEQFKHYYLTLPVQMHPNCDEETDDGEKTIIVSAFGLQATTKVRLEDVDEDVCEDFVDYFRSLEKAQKGTINYRILELPAQIDLASPFDLDVEIANEDAFHDYTLWPYIYRGSKCYSCEDNTKQRDHLAKRVSLEKSEKRVITFQVPTDSSIAAGNYKLKVKIRKDNQKTTKDITKDIAIINTKASLITQKKREQEIDVASGSEQEQSLSPYGIDAQKRAILDKIPGIVVYESNGTKASRLRIYFILISLALLCIVLVRQKT